MLAVLFLTALVVAFGNVVYLEPFYALPITLASWYGSRKSGILLTLFSLLLLILAKVITMPDHEGVQIYLLEYTSYAIAYVSLAIIVTNFRNIHRVEVMAADTDDLTGISNSRSFYADLANELIRSLRYGHIFSLVYLDIDNFKRINDSRGHLEGDRLLIEVAHCLRTNLRKTDTAARLGGDEFACLFPETDQEAAKIAFTKTSDLLRRRMSQHKWPVTFSAGLVTFQTLPDDIKEALKIADELMYTVKNGQKDNIAYIVWNGKNIT